MTGVPNMDYVVHLSCGNSIQVRISITEISGYGLFEWPSRDFYIHREERLNISLSEQGVLVIHKYPSEGYVVSRDTWLPETCEAEGEVL